MSRKVVSSFSAEPAYLYLADYFAKKLKVNKNRFIRLTIACFARQFLTAEELEKKPLIRRWYSEVIDREIFGNTRLKNLIKEVDSQDSEIIRKGGFYGKQEDRTKITRK